MYNSHSHLLVIKLTSKENNYMYLFSTGYSVEVI